MLKNKLLGVNVHLGAFLFNRGLTTKDKDMKNMTSADQSASRCSLFLCQRDYL